jgi:hypothetical protein
MLRRTVTNIISQLVLADRLRMLARIAVALVQRIDLAVRPRDSHWTIARVPAPVRDATNAAVLARIRVAIVSAELAVLPVESLGTGALVSCVYRGAHAAVLARCGRAKVDFGLAVAPHESRLAIAVVVVDQLDAVQSPGVRARIRQALVDVALASRPHESRGTFALEPAHPVDAGAVVVASSRSAVVDVDLAQESQSS